jgi:hypothetical protein
MKLGAKQQLRFMKTKVSLIMTDSNVEPFDAHTYYKELRAIGVNPQLLEMSWAGAASTSVSRV